MCDIFGTFRNEEKYQNFYQKYHNLKMFFVWFLLSNVSLSSKLLLTRFEMNNLTRKGYLPDTAYKRGSVIFMEKQKPKEAILISTIQESMLPANFAELFQEVPLPTPTTKIVISPGSPLYSAFADMFHIELNMIYQLERLLVRDHLGVRHVGVRIHTKETSSIKKTLLDINGIFGMTADEFLNIRSVRVPRKEECPLCMDEMILIPMMCKDSSVPHYVCEQCLLEWMGKTKNGKHFACPQCRHKFSKKEVEENIKNFAAEQMEKSKGLEIKMVNEIANDGGFHL